MLSARRSARFSWNYVSALGGFRVVLIAALLALATVGPEVRALMAQSLADAYLQVSVFVALTLGAIYLIEQRSKTNMAALLNRHRRWQVPAAALLGALPGCGGAVAVVTQYVQGSISFGALVAVLTATMGDAAFLLLASEPMTGLAVFALGTVVGTASGGIVDAAHAPGFMRIDRPEMARVMREVGFNRRNPLQPVWIILFFPGVVLGFLSLLQIDTDALFGPLRIYEPTQWIGLAGATLALSMWLLDPTQRFDPGVARYRSWVDRVVNATNFVTVWVVVGFLVYELGIHFTGVDLATWFDTWAPLVPLVAVLVGFLPGCGPQIIVTTLYISGALPLSAQLGNAISNDGDALFPTIALAPRAAVLATLYSGVPALIVAYGWFWLAGS
ncbi:MAG: putative manganese transporter [Rhodothalassiaceae bacterium]